MAFSPAVRLITSNRSNIFGQPAIRRDSSVLHFSQAIRFQAAIFCGRVRLSRTGFLDTFDPFDSSHGEQPRDFLDLA